MPNKSSQWRRLFTDEQKQAGFHPSVKMIQENDCVRLWWYHEMLFTNQPQASGIHCKLL